ncbi:hypothetical protein F4860DRAFT_377072 [Xylaria cubensis]|nr:hypothetical protein F4860DRAFT_377072 [Xylaria cubensis]
MGGTVIVKALCLAERETSQYLDIYESIAGCIFFGTPFKGADVAKIADYWAKLNEESGIAVNSQLLELLKPENDGLRELRGDFVKASGKLATKVELFCFYEQQPTSWDKIIAKLASQEFPPNLLSKLSGKECREFVSKDSATLDASYEMGLYRTHRDLVRFKSYRDPVYQAVKGPLKRIIQSASRIVRARFICTRQTAINPKTLQDVLSGMRGVDMQMKYEDLSDQLSEKSWILEEPEY